MKTESTAWAAAELRRYSDSKQASAHTPGPWKAVTADDDEPGLFSIWPDNDPADPRHLIASVYDSNGPLATDTATARLIAAAPELLEACEAAERVARVGFNAAEPEIVSLDRGTLQHLTNTLRAAIAKATGKGEA